MFPLSLLKYLFAKVHHFAQEILKGKQEWNKACVENWNSAKKIEHSNENLVPIEQACQEGVASF
jgi:hypothetical protein